MTSDVAPFHTGDRVIYRSGDRATVVRARYMPVGQWVLEVDWDDDYALRTIWRADRFKLEKADNG